MSTAKTPTQRRSTRDLLERADALIEVMAGDPEIRALGMPTRTSVLRLAMARGVRDSNASTRRRRPVPPPQLMTRPPARAGERSPMCTQGVTARTERQYGRMPPAWLHSY
jgi:hypothetical protein